MKKALSIILAILMIVTTIPFAFAAEEMTVLTEFCIYEDDYSYPGGWSNDNEENYHLGIQDEGKTAWEEGDELLIIFDEYDTDTWKRINTQTALLRYENEQFNGNISFVYDENSYIKTYGCIGKGGGTDEYLEIHCEIIDNVLYIVFPASRVHYSRLRIVGEANTSYDVTVDGFFTADNFEKPITQNYTLTTDNNGNAYLYGIFNEGAILSVNGVACTLDYRNGTVSEKSYAVCAVHNFSDGCCTECYVKCAHANCSNSVCNDCGYICLHSDTIVQVDAKAPTCTQVGNEAYEYCTACDYSTYEEIPASTHIDANCDYKCDYNCGYVYETLDFSDAKVLTSVGGALYIDGVEAESNSSKSQSRIYEGKYILEGDIETSRYIWILGDTTLDLNGYTWNLADKYIIADMPLSVYDTSEAETGKITSNYSGPTIYNQDGVFSLYGGTIESTSNSPVIKVVTANLYAGKIKGNSYAISCNLGDDVTINIDDTVLEISEKKADFYVHFSSYDRAIGFIDVTDYKGDSLTARVDLYNTIGKITVFKGIKNAQDAEKYQITDVVCDEYYDLFWEKTEYDEATGEKSIYTAKRAFTQQPTVDNNYTVDFNNYPATFQWYEVEEENLGTYEVASEGKIFTYDFKAGDILNIFINSEFEYIDFKIGNEYFMLENGDSFVSAAFNEDKTVDVCLSYLSPGNPVEIEFTVLKGTKLDGETEKTLQNAECGKSYCCKATVGENVYVSDSVVGHSLVSVDAQAPTCTEIGWDAYEYCTDCDYTTYVEIPVDNDAHTDANCDYKCDYNCGYVYETLDFSDAKVLTTVDGVLYIDGVEAETNSSKSQSRIYGGKYILEGDIETSRYIWIFGDTTLDLNGYTWNLTDKYINVNAPLSVYDTSEAETGKITSGSSSLTININDVAAGFNLYGGTIENTSISSRCALDVTWADVNLYAGKIKSNSSAINLNAGQAITINIDGTVIESGDGYADVRLELGSGIGITKGVVDVTDYNGASLTACVSLYDTVGKITVFKGIKNAQDAEKYQIIDVVCDKYYDTYWEKTEYDEATGEKSIYTANNAFTQQPSADNNFTVDFNNPAATFQWYEVEEKNLGTYIVERFNPLFSYDFKAGDVLKVSTDSEFELVVIEAGNEYIELMENEKTAITTFDADTTIDCFAILVYADNPVEVNFTVFKETKLDGETEKTLQNAECGKSYYCKAAVGEKVYASDSVVGHSLVSVDAQAPTCTEIGWDAYEYCTACNYTTYVEIPENGHTPLEAVKENEVASKCGVAGSYDLVVYCDDCGAELDRDTKTVDALTHTDADGDYICDNGCGHEFEKPAPEEPTPDTPDEPEDETCADCGKVHTNFFSEIICFFTRIFNFIKNLFA